MGTVLTLPAARLVGAEGTVYGLDIDAGSVASLQRGALEAGLRNVQTKVGRAEEEVLCTGCADIIFFGTVLHDFQNPEQVLRNARQMIKPEGILADLDWRKEPTPFGPPVSIRFSPETATSLIESSDLRIDRLLECGPYHYLILAKAAG